MPYIPLKRENNKGSLRDSLECLFLLDPTSVVCVRTTHTQSRFEGQQGKRDMSMVMPPPTTPPPPSFLSSPSTFPSLSFSSLRSFFIYPTFAMYLSHVSAYLSLSPMSLSAKPLFSRVLHHKTHKKDDRVATNRKICTIEAYRQPIPSPSPFFPYSALSGIQENHNHNKQNSKTTKAATKKHRLQKKKCSFFTPSSSYFKYDPMSCVQAAAFILDPIQNTMENNLLSYFFDALAPRQSALTCKPLLLRCFMHSVNDFIIVPGERE